MGMPGSRLSTAVTAASVPLAAPFPAAALGVGGTLYSLRRFLGVLGYPLVATRLSKGIEMLRSASGTVPASPTCLIRHEGTNGLCWMHLKA